MSSDTFTGIVYLVGAVLGIVVGYIAGRYLARRRS